jgi:calcineurin-like phosphoesterase family protein
MMRLIMKKWFIADTHFSHTNDKRPRKIISNQLNLCVEVWDYKPVAEKTILSLLDKASNTISYVKPR